MGLSSRKQQHNIAPLRLFPISQPQLMSRMLSQQENPNLPSPQHSSPAQGRQGPRGFGSSQLLLNPMPHLTSLQGTTFWSLFSSACPLPRDPQDQLCASSGVLTELSTLHHTVILGGTGGRGMGAGPVSCCRDAGAAAWDRSQVGRCCLRGPSALGGEGIPPVQNLTTSGL